MKKLPGRSFAIALCIMLGQIASARAESIGPLQEKARLVADALVNDYGVTSVQYAVIDRGAIVLSGGGGVFDKEEKRAITRDDMYGIGSTSKMFATAAAMSLLDRGLIALDEPLTRYIPEFTMKDERYRKITPRMLMNHSSGLYGSSLGNAFLFDDADPRMHDTLLSLLAGQRLKADPGQFSEYCNDGFTLLEILVERVGGMRYRDFLAERFLSPLGLGNTAAPQDAFDKGKRLVKVYSPHYSGRLPAETVNALGTGGLYSTAEDLCRFARVLMGKVPELLSEQSALLMQNEEYKRGMWVNAPDGNILGDYGLGWDTVHSFPFGDYGLRVMTKGGDTLLFHSSLVTIPSLDIAMAVVSSGGASIFDYAFAANILQEYLLEKRIIREISPPRTFAAPIRAEMPRELEACSGLYVNASSWAKILVQDGILTVSKPGGEPEERWVYAGEKGFLSEDGRFGRSFSLQSDGELYLRRSRMFSLPKVGQVHMTDLEYQRVEPNALAEGVMKAWASRAGKKYYGINEKASAQSYLMGADSIRMRLSDDFSTGFAFGGTKIIDEDSAVNSVKFRDVLDLEFRVKDGVEYLYQNEYVYIREDFIPRLTTMSATIAIGDDGLARFYAFGPEFQGKMLAVILPEAAAYAVYDENDACVNFTTVSGNGTTVLPQGGRMVLIGKPGDIFALDIH